MDEVVQEVCQLDNTEVQLMQQAAIFQVSVAW